MTTAKTKLGETLKSGRLALTAECFPPPSADASAIKRLSDALPPNLDAVIAAELSCAAIVAREGRSSILSMVTRDRNRIALQRDALGAAALGVGGVLCLSGDHQSLGACPTAAGVYDIDSIQLVQALKRMTLEGVDFSGQKLDAPPELLIGAAAHPYLRPLELNLLRLKKKIAAGVDFLLTQEVSDMAGFAEWMDAVRAAGLDEQVAILASVSAATAGMAAQLKTTAGVRGIHILSGGRESLAAAVIQEAGLA